MNNIQNTLLKWYKKNKRDLPWRKTKDPYRILVSEVMLQQTQVDRVIPKYHAFLKKYPTITDLANASPADVINEWAGLGYNRRALYLHKCAVTTKQHHNGQLPQEKEQLQALPGIGPYTTQAIRCFGFHMDVPVVDINIQRIYSRVFFKGEGTKNELHNTAREMVPLGHGVEWNNGLMDFGSTICADKPKCTICPIKEQCTAFKAGTPEKYVKPKTQSKFIGSDRFYRSAIIKHLRTQSNYSTTREDVYRMKPKNKSMEWFDNILNTLERDGLIKKEENKISLPTFDQSN